MWGWIVGGIIVALLIIWIISKARKNYNIVHTSGAGASGGVVGFLKACCGRGRY